MLKNTNANVHISARKLWTHVVCRDDSEAHWKTKRTTGLAAAAAEPAAVEAARAA